MVSKEEVERRIFENVMEDYEKYGFDHLAVKMKVEKKFIGFARLSV